MAPNADVSQGTNEQGRLKEVCRRRRMGTVSTVSSPGREQARQNNCECPNPPRLASCIYYCIFSRYRFVVCNSSGTKRADTMKTQAKLWQWEKKELPKKTENESSHIGSPKWRRLNCMGLWCALIFYSNVILDLQ